jgi:DNA helicase TIP49 (TBP-interacting protein)
MLQEKTTRTNIRSTERIRIGCSGKSFESSNLENEGEYDCRNSTNKGENMKKIVLSIALAFVAPFAWGQVSETTTTTTTTDASGTITEYTPGSQIVLKETSGPRTYRFGKTVTYVTRSGKVLDADVVKTKVKVGVPVRVHYVGTGDSMMVDRVILDED